MPFHCMHHTDTCEGIQDEVPHIKTPCTESDLFPYSGDWLCVCVCVNTYTATHIILVTVCVIKPSTLCILTAHYFRIPSVLRMILPDATRNKIKWAVVSNSAKIENLYQYLCIKN